MRIEILTFYFNLMSEFLLIFIGCQHLFFNFKAFFMVIILIAQGLLFTLSSGAAVCNNGAVKGHGGSSPHHCKHSNFLESSEKIIPVASSLSPVENDYYVATPPPPMKQRVLPKNPYADYVEYYSRT